MAPLMSLTVSDSSCDLLESSGDAPVLHLTKEQLVVLLLGCCSPVVPPLSWCTGLSPYTSSTPMTLLPWQPSGPPTGAALSNLWATERPTCYEPGINQTAWGGRNNLWPPPEKHSLRQVVWLIPPFATELLHCIDYVPFMYWFLFFY